MLFGYDIPFNLLYFGTVLPFYPGLPPGLGYLNCSKLHHRILVCDDFLPYYGIILNNRDAVNGSNPDGVTTLLYLEPISQGSLVVVLSSLRS